MYIYIYILKQENNIVLTLMVSLWHLLSMSIFTITRVFHINRSFMDL